MDLLQSAQRANGTEREMVASDWATLLVFLGLPMLVSLSASISSLFMTSTQRDADLALLGVVGATPSQRVLLPSWEALMFTVTGALMGLMMAISSGAYLVIGIVAGGARAGWPDNPWVCVVSVGGSLVVTWAATVLPTLFARRLPEQVVIARRVAD